MFNKIIVVRLPSLFPVLLIVFIITFPAKQITAYSIMHRYQSAYSSIVQKFARRIDRDPLKLLTGNGIIRCLSSSSSSVSFSSSSSADADIIAAQYRLIDCGNLKRMEVFGGKTVVRPCPSAMWPSTHPTSTLLANDEEVDFMYYTKQDRTAANTATATIGKNRRPASGSESGGEILYGCWRGREMKQWASNRVLATGAATASTTTTTSTAATATRDERAEAAGMEEDGETYTWLHRHSYFSSDSHYSRSNINSTSNNIYDGMTFKLSLAANGQIGIFPEQTENWRWLRDQTRFIDTSAHNSHSHNSSNSINNSNNDESGKYLGLPVDSATDNSDCCTGAGSGVADYSYSAQNGACSEIHILNGFAYTGGSTMACLSGLLLGQCDHQQHKQYMHHNKQLKVIEEHKEQQQVLGAGGALKSVASVKDCYLAPQVYITHLDASKSALRRARDNIELHLKEGEIGVTNRNINVKYVQEDCLTFVQREIRRSSRSNTGNASSTGTNRGGGGEEEEQEGEGKEEEEDEEQTAGAGKYSGLIFDPPAFGRNKRSKRDWKLNRDMPTLIELIPKLLCKNPSFVLLSCHDVDWPPSRLHDELKLVMQRFEKRHGITGAAMESGVMSVFQEAAGGINSSNSYSNGEGEGVQQKQGQQQQRQQQRLNLGSYVRWWNTQGRG